MTPAEYQLRQLQQGVGAAHQAARAAEERAAQATGECSLLKNQVSLMTKDLANLADALASVKGSGPGSANSNQHIMYIEQIPGRRVPFDLLVNIPIGNDVTAVQQATEVISQDGPFVAVARYAAFQSAFQFQRRDPETQNLATFQGRSFGRWRPPSSSWDLNDGRAGFQPVAPLPFPGTGAPIIASPSNQSSFRSMEFDGVVTMLNQGAAYPRSNIDVPSTFYTTAINSPFQLGALDFFERGETIQWKVTPTHINNPRAGNLSGYAGGGLYPFLASQYDVHEGIDDAVDPAASDDPITRLPDGILSIGLHGFRIIQPPGPVSV